MGFKKIAAIKIKASQVDDQRAVDICKAAKAGINDLSRLMTDAYAIRVIADYHPETPVELHEERFALDRTSITTAHRWVERARSNILKIERAWDLGNGI